MSIFANDPDLSNQPTPEPPELPPQKHAVHDAEGKEIGSVELPSPGPSRFEFEHLKHDFMQLRNLVIRLQTQVKLLEGRIGRR